MIMKINIFIVLQKRQSSIRHRNLPRFKFMYSFFIYIIFNRYYGYCYYCWLMKNMFSKNCWLKAKCKKQQHLVVETGNAGFSSLSLHVPKGSLIFFFSDWHQVGQTAGAPDHWGRLFLLMLCTHPEGEKKKTSFTPHACFVASYWLTAVDFARCESGLLTWRLVIGWSEQCVGLVRK